MLSSPNLSAGLRALALGGAVLVLAACGGAADNSNAGATGAPAANAVAGAIPEPNNPGDVKEYTDYSALQAYKPAADLVPADVRERGVIVFGTDPSTAPTRFLGSDGKTFVGLDADIARMIGKTLDMKVQFKSSTFDAIIPGLQSKRFDAAIADMGVTPKRLAVVDMIGYANAGQALVTKPGNPTKISENEMCGHTVGVTTGSLQAVERGPKYSKTCQDQGKPAIKLVDIPTQQEILLQVASGQLEAGYIDATTAAWAAKQKAGSVEMADVFPGSVLSMATPDGSELTPALVQAIKHVATLPEYKESLDRWGLNYALLDPKYLDSYDAPPTAPPITLKP